ncbi:MAG: ABC transporter permease [Puniceicoccales bacterium]|jgi:lipoprotein-releasing system permease protein|nr:ABC transporter permease [Puniceicoccales bacterium]
MYWYFYLALRNLFPFRKIVSFFSLVSVVGVAIGVAVLIVVQSVMNGFNNQTKSNIINTQGEVRVECSSMTGDLEFLEKFFTNDASVSAVSSYATGVVILRYEDRTAFPLVKGVDLGKECQVMALERFVKSGKIDELDDGTIFLGSGLARSLGLRVGDMVDIYSPRMITTIGSDDVQLPREVRVGCIFETGVNYVDNGSGICSLPFIQDLCDLGSGIHGMVIKLNVRESIDDFVRRMRSVLPSAVTIFSWKELNKDLLFVLQLEKTMMFFTLMFILLVASFSISSTLMTSVVRKTKEIGLLRALGATRFQITMCFFIQGLLIGCCGTFLGCLFAWLVLRYRDFIVDLMAKIFNSSWMLSKFSNFVYLPVACSGYEITIIVLFSVFICMLAGVFPAWRAMRVQPAIALRNE